MLLHLLFFMYKRRGNGDIKIFLYLLFSLSVQVWWVDSSSQREYGGEKEYLHETQMLWTKEDSPDSLALFPAGSHTFPFRFHLPSKIPSSFEGRVGWVRYELQGRIVTGVMKVEHLVEIELPVMEIVDINQSHLLVVKSVQVQKKVWSFPCTLSNVSMVVGLSRTGFCVGEDIPLNVGLENGSRYEVTLTAVLRQKITYTAKRTRRQYDKATVVEVTSQRFAPRISTIWPTNLRVPLQEATTQDYEVIHVEYRIKVVASVGWGQTLVAKIPITIGNIPFSNSLVDRDIHCSRDQLQFGSYDDQYSLLSTDDRSSRQFGLSQLDHTPKSLLPHSESQQSCDVFTTTGSYLYDSECTYSVRDYIDGGEFSDSDLCTQQNSN